MTADLNLPINATIRLALQLTSSIGTTVISCDVIVMGFRHDGTYVSLQSTGDVLSVFRPHVQNSQEGQS